MKRSPGTRVTVVAASLWAAALIVYAWRPAAGQAVGADSFGRRVIRAEDIRQSGATRLSDVMLLVDAWTPTTLDGFTWQASPRGLDPYQTASWLVMVDGVRIDAGEFGVTPLNVVPVHVGDIDSVEVVEIPRLHDGEFAGAGLIHIHTRRNTPGYDAGVSASTGNEAGDPGPWAYTPLATPNVDRIGPRYALRGSYGAERASVGASCLWDTHYATDAAVRERTFGISGGDYPQMTLVGGSAEVAARFIGGWHRVSFSTSRFEDFFFFKPYGREIPVVSRLSVASLTGRLPLGGSVDLDYRLNRTGRGIGYRTNAFGLDFDWRTTTWLGGADISLGTPAFRHRYSVGYERVEAATGYVLTRPDYDVFKIGADWEWSFRDNIVYRAGAMATDGEGGVSLEGTAAGRWRINDWNRLEAVATYDERRPERDGRIWFWQGRGYDFLQDAGVDVTAEGPLGTAHRWGMDIAWAAAPNRVAAGSVSGYYRGFSHLLIEEQTYGYNAQEEAFSGPVRLVPERRGDVAGAELRAEVRASSRIRFRTTYRYERAVSGDALFRNVWDAVPRHVLAETVAYTPAPSVALWGRFVWMSATRWHDYDEAEAETGGVYRSTLDDVVALDLALTKWLWRGRLKGHLLLRNLLGTAPVYHPIGASFDTTVFAGIELRVGGSAGGGSGAGADDRVGRVPGGGIRGGIGGGEN